MMENISTTLVSYFLKGIPECVALTMLTISILKLKNVWKKILITGLAVATIVLIVRTVLLSTGLHTALAILSMALLVSFFFKVPKLNSIVASTISMIVLCICEFSVFYFFKTFWGMDINDLAQNHLLWVLNSWICTFIIVLTSILIQKINKQPEHYRNFIKSK